MKKWNGKSVIYRRAVPALSHSPNIQMTDTGIHELGTSSRSRHSAWRQARNSVRCPARVIHCHIGSLARTHFPFISSPLPTQRENKELKQKKEPISATGMQRAPVGPVGPPHGREEISEKTRHAPWMYDPGPTPIDMTSPLPGSDRAVYGPGWGLKR